MYSVDRICVMVRLTGRPSYSRCGPEIEIPDIEDAEGVDYLVSQGLAQPIARSLVADLTGGRMSLMNKYLDLLKAYTPEGICQTSHLFAATQY